MASKEQQEILTLTLGKRRSEEIDDEEEEKEEEREIEELEREVKEMAQKIIESRKTMPDLIFEAFSSYLIAQRPELTHPQIGPTSSPPDQAAQAGTSGDPGTEMREQSELSEGASLAEADQEMLKKLQIFRAKTASNIAAMPAILKRMNECIARIDRIEQYNVNIHSVFKRKRK